MKTINFHIHYPTRFGEELYVHVRTAQNDGSVKERRLKMDHWQDDLWTCQTQVPEKQQAVDYFFTMGDGHDTKRREWTTIPHRLLTACADTKMFNVYCRWQEMPEDSYRYSVAFTDTLNHQQPHALPKTSTGRTVRLVVRAPQLLEGQRLAVIGNSEELGEWDTRRAVPMTQQNYNEWAVDLDAKTLSGEDIELKFAIIREDRPDFFLWEEGLNREISVGDVQQGELVVYGSTGVCRVEGIGNPDPRDRSGRQYYLLKPLYQDGTIYTPVEGGKVPMRPVMSAAEAEELIAQIPQLNPEVCRERTLQLLSQRYQAMLHSGNSRDLLELTISVYRKRRQAEDQNRRLGMVDERFAKQAERLLFGELAVALDISPEEVPALIAARLEKASVPV